MRFKVLISSLLIVVAVVLSLCAANQDTNEVLCRTQYSASIGGENEPVAGVNVTISGNTYITDDKGHVEIPLKSGKNYTITVSYKSVSKSTKLKYSGEDILLISIDPHEPKIHDIKFLQPQPSGGEN